MKTVIETTVENQYSVTVAQHRNSAFTVTYGADITSGLDWVDAAHRYGECVFHALQCQGLIEED